MQNSQILDEVLSLITTVSPDSNIDTITTDTIIEEIEEWDSLNNVTLEMELENKFHFEFQTGEFQDLHTINDLVGFLAVKINR